MKMETWNRDGPAQANLSSTSFPIFTFQEFAALEA